MASPAERGRAAAERYWTECRKICAESGRATDDDAVGFVAGSALMTTLSESARDGGGLRGVFRGFAGTAKYDGVSKKKLVSAFRHVCEGVFNVARLNQ